jgi:hypothetical protein
MNSLIFLPVPFRIVGVGLSNRQRWWIKQPQAVLKLGNTPLFLKHAGASSVRLSVFGGTGREPKKTPPLRLPSLALLCGYPIHPILKITAREKFMSYAKPKNRILKQYKAISIKNLVHHFSVTAYSLNEAISLLPAFTAVVSWAPAQEAAL